MRRLLIALLLLLAGCGGAPPEKALPGAESKALGGFEVVGYANYSTLPSNTRLVRVELIRRGNLCLLVTYYSGTHDTEIVDLHHCTSVR